MIRRFGHRGTVNFSLNLHVFLSKIISGFVSLLGVVLNEIDRVSEDDNEVEHTQLS